MIKLSLDLRIPRVQTHKECIFFFLGARNLLRVLTFGFGKRVVYDSICSYIKEKGRGGDQSKRSSAD